MDIPSRKPLQLFEDTPLVKVSAPMVRYSKLAFRNLVRKYGCDLCFTPMIVADSFIKSKNARDNDFTYCKSDRPLIVQFASSNAENFRHAAELVYPYSDGVDLNCGCPQRWAIQEGYGACLINKPELVSDIIHQTRNAICDSEFSVSLKIRIHNDTKRTVDFARQMESAGLTFLSVHGRTKEQRSEPVNYEAISLIKSSINIPVIANGDIKTLNEAEHIKKLTNVDGVMCARGLLANPSLFSGTEFTTLDCVKDWIKIAIETGTPFTCFHNHLIYMIEKLQSRADRRYFNALSSVSGVVSFLEQKYSFDVSLI
ncbi:tRNA-dihydrouridine(20a/20b) synthase [NAD(P)+]-like [Armadillidium nasatum]|uniref:tRNA-dihydrouridine synthase n=1 Tax=Armadillidium nasatum TaxID=96803 RepID=A0A5N5SJQ4_9CRUS|nr:tRNA-dihydrouridine(20a/20b) synthase [NAD(P)+]-like [Armadillidium nasatum]KAB7502907.1 tRNA-dihydrouridine(20a/20b) synthase [NAD(P)+]-like [Armadillidium nasatum]